MKKQVNDMVVLYKGDRWVLNRLSKNIYLNGVRIARDTESFISAKLVYPTFRSWVVQMADFFKAVDTTGAKVWLGAPQRQGWLRKKR